jgi:hypothetical protein
MFDEPKNSLGQLDDVEREWMLQFLNGTPWEELFETLEDGSMPPPWLVEWSSSWTTDTVLTIDELDPNWSDGWLITDSLNDERWFVVKECGETFSVFERISDDQAVAQAVLNYLKSVGHVPILGRLQINPDWIALPIMREYMEGAKRDTGQHYLQDAPNLTLEQWLKREYGDGSEPVTAQFNQLR